MSLLKDAWDIIKDRAEWKETQALAAKVPELEKRIASLEERLGGNPSGDVCEHCGSTNLRRTGTRPSPGIFAKVGLKEAIFVCEDCGGNTFVDLRHV